MIQSAIIYAIKGDIRKRLVSSTKNISNLEPDQLIAIRNLGNYANKLKRQYEVSKDFVKLKRRWQAKHSSRHMDEEAIITPIGAILSITLLLYHKCIWMAIVV